MGNAMKNKAEHRHLWDPDYPHPFGPLKYDPHFGFKEGERKLKVHDVTLEEMNSAGLRPEERDHCAYYRIYTNQCLDRNWPFYLKCDALRHELNHCLAEERLHDMKEFERERRLNARERRIREGTIKA